MGYTILRKYLILEKKRSISVLKNFNIHICLIQLKTIVRIKQKNTKSLLKQSIENKNILKNGNKFTDFYINKLCNHVQFKDANSFSQGLCYECFVSHNKLSGGIYGGSNPPSYIKVFKKRNIKKQKTYNRILYLKVSSKLQPNYCFHYGKEKSNYILSEVLSGKKKFKTVTKVSSLEDHNQNLKLNSTTSIFQITNKKAKKYSTNIGNFNDSIDKYLRLFDNKTDL